MVPSFTPNALAVVDSARALSKELHHEYVGREHLLFAFVSGAGGDIARIGFESCGLTTDAVRSAIEYVDGSGSVGSEAQQAAINSTMQDRTLTLSDTTGIQSLVAAQLFAGFTPAADVVFKMARNEAKTDEIHAEEILYVFLREAERSEYDRRIMQVIHQIVPDLTIDVIKASVIKSFDDAIPKRKRDLSMLKRVRDALMYTRTTLEA